MFRGRKRNHSDVWSLVRFHVSLWVSISKTFCNYSIDNILLNWGLLVDRVVC